MSGCDYSRGRLRNEVKGAQTGDKWPSWGTGQGPHDLRAWRAR
ncbi:conserved hypothetical protein [Acidithiobacillus caldus SM-1]|uniref:Uncharacterized protein n=2 Tax=Acidithiobacillus caldus TaxID=33059 RepID=F9ZPD8_ACICS|nr:conserved hypothetical protein [Acidithiobacillus caldus SM-1]AIA54249.1 hypothetical protein Acaty_c0359 [Acidithiobacillus caldus ATCC 51756]QER44495.1 hypothetical protein F0726_01424 [Acidithiobacillus caldus]